MGQTDRDKLRLSFLFTTEEKQKFWPMLLAICDKPVDTVLYFFLPLGLNVETGKILPFNNKKNKPIAIYLFNTEYWRRPCSREFVNKFKKRGQILKINKFSKAV